MVKKNTIVYIVSRDILWLTIFYIVWLLLGSRSIPAPIMLTITFDIIAATIVARSTSAYTKNQRRFLGFVRWLSLLSIVAIPLLIAVMLRTDLSTTLPGPMFRQPYVWTWSLQLLLFIIPIALTYRLLLIWFNLTTNQNNIPSESLRRPATVIIAAAVIAILGSFLFT